LTCSRYAANSVCTASGACEASSAARSESAATTKKVAPNRVSGRVVYTVTGRGRTPAEPLISKTTSAPLDRPIQFRCMVSTCSGHWPCSCFMSSSSRSAYSVIRKYHWVSFFFVTGVSQRSHRPFTTCSFASTV
jgi:hypothetical protein